MDPLVTSALISAGSNILGGFFGGDKPQSPKTQAYIDAEYFGTNLDKRVAHLKKVAKKRKVPFLTLLGAQPIAGSSGLQVGDKDADIASIGRELGQNVSRAISAKHTREIQQLQKEQLQADIDLTKAQTTNILTQPTQNAPYNATDLEGTKKNPIPLYIWVKDPKTGKMTQKLNTKAVEGIESAGYPTAALESTILAKEVFSGYGKDVGEKTSKDMLKILEKRHPHLTRKALYKLLELYINYKKGK